MGIGIANGENRAQVAAKAAVSSPLLELSINGAKGVLFAIAGGDDLGMIEVHEAAKIVTESVDPNAKIIFGAIKDDKLKKGDVRVTVIATGFPAPGVAPRGTQLFTFGSGREEKEEKPIGKIFNTPEPAPMAKEEPKKQIPVIGDDVPPPQAVINPKKKEDDDDEWGAVPSFLRRPKLK
jgi:cell division protein FtsZ